MSKTVKVPLRNRLHPETIDVDVGRFIAAAARLTNEPTEFHNSGLPRSWFDAALLAIDDDGLVVVTPRGDDLIASAKHLPEDPKPEQRPCSKCNGVGEVAALLVSMETCPRCGGSQVEPTMRNPYNEITLTLTFVEPRTYVNERLVLVGNSDV